MRNLTVYRGAGLSVGSVHPSTRKPCVDGVLFEDIVLYQPTKGPYVKPVLAGSDCDGLGFDGCHKCEYDVRLTYCHTPGEACEACSHGSPRRVGFGQLLAGERTAVCMNAPPRWLRID